mgnify:CR=1 FL=1
MTKFNPIKIIKDNFYITEENYLLLINKKYNINMVDDYGNNLLILDLNRLNAIDNNSYNFQYISFLIKNNIDIYKKNMYGKSVFYCSIQNHVFSDISFKDSYKASCLLLDKGVKIKDYLQDCIENNLLNTIEYSFKYLEKEEIDFFEKIFNNKNNKNKLKNSHLLEQFNIIKNNFLLTEKIINPLKINNNNKIKKI